MEVGYANRVLERLCTEERFMQRTLGAHVARALRLRVAELRYASETADLLLGTGRREQLKGDRAGDWSARLTANWRLIVRPEVNPTAAVVVVEIVDYHGR